MDTKKTERVDGKMPGLRGWEGVRAFGGLRRDPLLFLTEGARRYGGIFGFRVLGRRYVVVSEPEMAKEILLVQAEAFWKGRALRNSKGLLGEGLLTSEGEVHKCQRRVMQPAFHAKRVEGYGEEVVGSVRALIERWRAQEHASATEVAAEAWHPAESKGKLGKEGFVVDVRREMMGLTLVIAGRALFGTMLEEEVALVGRCMEVLVGNYRRTVVPWGKLLNVLPLPSTLELRRAQRGLRGLVGRMIAARKLEMCANARAQYANEGSALPDGRGTGGLGGSDKADLLSALLAATDPEGDGKDGKLTDVQVRDQAITILVAGHETTANAMTFTLWLLARHPEEQERLRAEVVGVLGGREPGVEDLGRMERVRWVLSESMRLYPPAWTIGRENQREVEVGGYRVKRGATFLIPQWVMHRDERWFEDAREFRPGRWEEPRHPRYAYLPFSTGARNCIGESFAWVEMMLALAMLVRDFKFELEGSGEMGLVAAITLRPREVVRMRVVGRD